jgi:hypothetical protein
MSKLAFERFNEEGNSPDAVIYMPEEGLLIHKSRQYLVEMFIPRDVKITKLSVNEDGKSIVMQFNSRTDRIVKCVCPYHTTVPDKDQMLKLNAMFRKHGAELADVVDKMKDLSEHAKMIIMKNKQELKALCPDLSFDELDVDSDDESEFPSYIYNFHNVNTISGTVEDLVYGANYLKDPSNIVTHSKKRKAC